MIQRFSDGFGVYPPPEAAHFLNLMDAVLSDEAYQALVNGALSTMSNWEQRKPLLFAGHFSMMDLLNLLLRASGASGVNHQSASMLLKQLVDWSLVADNDFQLPNQYVRYQWNKAGISLFKTLSILDNVLLGRAYVASKYKTSIPAIIVEKDGVERIGTGFLVHNHFSGKHFDGNGHIFTARHNVDPADGIRLARFETGTPIEFESRGDWKFHPTLDIAAMQVFSKGAIPIYPMGDATILSRTISLGYPQISTSDGPSLLAHSGELNAVITSYFDQKQYLIVSNNVSPGNSGGPVLNDAGLCVGMVIRSLETEHEGGITKANAAIPARELQDFLNPL